MHHENGHLDFLAEDEAEATAITKKLLSYFQGVKKDWEEKDQIPLRTMIPEDRRKGFPVRDVLNTIADENSFLEMTHHLGIQTCSDSLYAFHTI